jgi:hypothetical protein
MYMDIVFDAGSIILQLEVDFLPGRRVQPGPTRCDLDAGYPGSHGYAHNLSIVPRITESHLKSYVISLMLVQVTAGRVPESPIDENFFEKSKRLL